MPASFSCGLDVTSGWPLSSCWPGCDEHLGDDAGVRRRRSGAPSSSPRCVSSGWPGCDRVADGDQHVAAPARASGRRCEPARPASSGDDEPRRHAQREPAAVDAHACRRRTVASAVRAMVAGDRVERRPARRRRPDRCSALGAVERVVRRRARRCALRCGCDGLLRHPMRERCQHGARRGARRRAPRRRRRAVRAAGRRRARVRSSQPVSMPSPCWVVDLGELPRAAQTSSSRLVVGPIRSCAWRSADAQPPGRLGAGGAVGDHLGDHRVVVRATPSSRDSTRAVDAHARRSSGTRTRGTCPSWAGSR